MGLGMVVASVGVAPLLVFVRKGAVAASRITHQELSTAGYVLKKMKSSVYFTNLQH
jgi:hypothetical protein